MLGSEIGHYKVVRLLGKGGMGEVYSTRLQALRRTLASEPVPGAPPNEFYGPYVNAPVWPWFAAGWMIGALFVVLFVIAWSFS
jgi:hypothetical protein